MCVCTLFNFNPLSSETKIAHVEGQFMINRTLLKTPKSTTASSQAIQLLLAILKIYRVGSDHGHNSIGDPTGATFAGTTTGNQLNVAPDTIINANNVIEY